MKSLWQVGSLVLFALQLTNSARADFGPLPPNRDPSGTVRPDLGAGQTYEHGVWTCYGTPLNNPMRRGICGQGPYESYARQNCGMGYVDIQCFPY